RGGSGGGGNRVGRGQGQSEKNRRGGGDGGGGACVVLCVRSRKPAPPPTASTDTASMTSALLRSTKPKRDLCACSKAEVSLRRSVLSILASRLSTAAPLAAACSLPRLRGRGGEGEDNLAERASMPPPRPSSASGGGNPVALAFASEKPEASASPAIVKAGTSSAVSVPA